MDSKDKQIQELSHDNIKFRQHIERLDEENKRLLSIIEQAEKVLTHFAEEPYLISLGYSTKAIEALKAIRGN